jgi:peptidoglycan/xylan/chitin deacetylase (PgdA/CDA1 family)
MMGGATPAAPARVPRYSERLAPGACAIFLLHGVIERQVSPVRNYNRKHIERAYFRAFLEDLSARGRALSMDEVLERCLAGDPFPDHSFAITFDDGFENNHSVAAPVLEDLGIPAMFYVTTRFIDENGMSWIDRIEAVLENAPAGALQLPWEDEPRPYRGPADKIALLEEIRKVVKSDPRMDVDALADSLAAALGRAPAVSGDGPLDKKMSWAMVSELSRHPLFTVGGHSHTHRILSFLDAASLAGEIGGSLRLLRDKAGVRPEHYSYPEGLEHCYSEAVIGRLRAEGVRCSPTAIDGVNGRGSHPFHLKRIMVT